MGPRGGEFQSWEAGGEAENDIVSLASSFLTVQVFRFAFTGGGWPHWINWRINWMNLTSDLSFDVVRFIL